MTGKGRPNARALPADATPPAYPATGATDSTGSADPTPPRTLLWRPDGSVERDCDAARILDVLHREPQARAWWLLPRRAGSDLQAAAELLGLDHLAMEDLLDEREPPKVDTLGQTAIVVTAAVHFDVGSTRLTVERISLIAGPRLLVLLADDRPAADLIAAVRRRSPDHRFHPKAADLALHAIIDVVVDGYGAALLAMEQCAEHLSELLFDDHPLSRADQLQAFRLRQAVTAIRRVTSPMVDVTTELAGAATRTEPVSRSGNDDRAEDDGGQDPLARLIGPETARRFADVRDHAAHAADSTTALRDELSSAFETNLALADVHLNQIMKKLSAWAAIIAVPTLVTGFFGMNVPYPGFGESNGFVVGLVIMVLAVVGLFVTFRRKEWL